MKRNFTYEQIISKKLNGLTPPHVTGLWDNMEAILDREMPQQKEKKRPVAWWRNANLLVAAGLFVAVGSMYTLSQVAGKEPVKTTVANTGTQAESAKGSNAGEQSEVSTAITAATIALPVKEKSVVGVAKPERSNQPAAGVVTVATASFPVSEPGRSVKATGSEAQPVQPTVIAESTIVNNESATNIVSAEAVAAANNERVDAITEPLKEATPEQAATPAFFDQQVVNTKTPVAIARKKKTTVFSDRGFTIGLAVSLPVAMGSQQKVGLDMQGKKNNWQDLAPAVYAQYHLSKKFYLQAEFQPVAAQYTPNSTLYDRTDVLNPDEKQQKVIKLNKLFYTALPISFHYNTPVKNLTVGLGVQYSKLKKIVLQDQEYYHLIGAGGVFNVNELKNEVVVKDPATVRNHSSGDVVDSVASSFRREDWRLMADVSYRYKTLQLGVRYSNGVSNYINTNFTNLQVKDRNESLQLYLRVNLFDSRKKTF